jgi:chromosome partitioning protein
LDCPPNLAILTINALAMSDYICLVSESEFLSKIALENLEQTIQQIQQQVNSSLEIFGVIITKINPITNHLKEIVEDIEEMYKDTRTFKVAHSVKVKDSPKEHMASIVKVFPKHKASKAYVEVAEAIINDK